jgi:hypothetical protein
MFKSTNTGSNGNWDFPAAVAVGGALTGTSAAFSTTLTAVGNSYFGAAMYKSTNTASTGAWEFPAAVYIGGALSGPTAITGTKLVASGAGSVGLYSRAAAELALITPAAAGQVYYCNDCGTVPLCVSTGTAQGGFALITNKASACQ